MQCHCYACLPASADSRRCALYLPAPVSTILFTEHHDPSHRRYHQDGSAAWTRSGNMLDIADKHSLQPPVLRPLPHGYQHLPTSPRDETQLSIVRTDRSTAPRPSDMPSPPRRPRSTTYTTRHTRRACLTRSILTGRETASLHRLPAWLGPLPLRPCTHPRADRPRPGIGAEEGGRRIRAGAVRDQLSSEHSSLETLFLDWESPARDLAASSSPCARLAGCDRSKSSMMTGRNH